MQITSGTDAAILAAITATGAPFDPVGTFVGLFTAIANRGANTALSDLTLAPGTFATALEVTTWGTAYTLDSGAWVRDGAAKVFTPASGADDCVVIGWYWADAATAGHLLSFGLLDAPIGLAFSPLRKLTIVPRVTVPLDGSWDASVSWNG